MEQTGPSAAAPGPAPAVRPLPPPPPPTPSPGPPPRRPLPVVPAEPGQLSLGWRVTTGVAWGLVFVGYVAVWKTSRELGLNTWWLGPLGDPAGWYVSMLPFLAPAAMIVLAVNNAKGLPWFGIGASASCAIVGLLDLGRVTRLGIVELVIAGAAAAAAIGSIAGRLQAGDH